MQKRIFRLAGQPSMATRDGGYCETHGTPMRILPEQGSDALSVGQDAEQPPRPEHETMGDAAPMPPAQGATEPVAAEAAAPEKIASATARTARRRRAGAAVEPRHGDANPADAPGKEAGASDGAPGAPDSPKPHDDKLAGTVRAAEGGKPDR